MPFVLSGCVFITFSFTSFFPLPLSLLLHSSLCSFSSLGPLPKFFFDNLKHHILYYRKSQEKKKFSLVLFKFLVPTIDDWYENINSIFLWFNIISKREVTFLLFFFFFFSYTPFIGNYKFLIKWQFMIWLIT